MIVIEIVRDHTMNFACVARVGAFNIDSRRVELMRLTSFDHRCLFYALLRGGLQELITQSKAL